MNNDNNNFNRWVSDIQRDLERTFIGADRIFDGFRNAIGTFDAYPPYNILKLDDDVYQVEMALAGFNKKDITVEKEKSILTISGSVEELTEDRNYLHRGIAARSFTRVVRLADDIDVGDAKMENGMLRIDLTRIVPESKKARIIKIK